MILSLRRLRLLRNSLLDINLLLGLSRLLRRLRLRGYRFWGDDYAVRNVILQFDPRTDEAKGEYVDSKFCGFYQWDGV